MAGHQLRRASSAVFGNRYRLELLLALADAGRKGICVKDLATLCGVPGAVFYPPLRALTAAGFVERLPGTGPNRRVFYAMTSVRAWTGLRQLVHDLESEAVRPGKRRGAKP
jgi:DNA-binding IclR family transcriptional regulator